MKQHSQKQSAGVWLDHHHAVIIASGPDGADAEYGIVETVKAEEERRGGDEHTINSGRQSDTLKYFKKVAAALTNYDALMIFGPGKSQEQFQNFLQEEAQFRNVKITLEAAEHMTDPQMVAKVREFFA